VNHASLADWALAVSPIALLLALVLWGRFSITVNGLVVIVTAGVIAVTAFGASAETLGVATGKGAATGVWILAVIWPALLLFRAASEMGLLQFGAKLGVLLPRPVENILVMAWIVPSFIQGVAGFGVPVAVAAPLLMQMGVGPVRAVALPLVGSHWSVGFGSMGSSFYMGSLTAQLDSHQTHAYAVTASLLSATNLILGGVLVCLMHGGWRSLKQGIPFLLLVGPAMALAQVLAVRAEPSIGALCAGAVGLVAVAALSLRHRRASRARTTGRPAHDLVSVTGAAGTQGGPALGGRDGRPADRDSSTADEFGARAAVLVALPYVLLTISVLAVFLNPLTRSWVKDHLLLGFDFPSTRSGGGHINPAAPDYSAIPLLGHPGTYILLAAIVSLLVWRLGGWWPRRRLRPMAAQWWRQARRSSPAVLLLAIAATLLTDSGMISTVASGVADVTGSHYPLLAAGVGMVGAFTTGSSTSSQALFAPMQYEIAHRVGFPESHALALQLTGSNVGNSISPMSALVGTSAVDHKELTSQVVRTAFLPALVLGLALVAGAGLLMAL
jgi:lactate permease